MSLTTLDQTLAHANASLALARTIRESLANTSAPTCLWRL